MFRYYIDELDEKNLFFSEMNMETLLHIQWIIPKELVNNGAALSNLDTLFKKMISYIHFIEICNFQLSCLSNNDNNKYLICKKKQEFKTKCYEIIKKINMKLSSDHWDMVEYLSNKQGYLIDLSTGKNQIFRRIQDM